MNLLLPLMGGVMATFFMFGKGEAATAPKSVEEKKAESETVKKTVAMAKAKDWDAAIANAIASRSTKVVKALIVELKKAKMGNAAKELGAVIKQWAEADKAKSTAISKPARVDSKPAKVEPKPKKPKKQPVTGGKAPQKVLELHEHLLSSKRYSENKDWVSEFQEANKLDADGKYGPASARVFWNVYSLLPPNPYYWPAKDTQAAVSSYAKFLDDIAKTKPALAGAVNERKKTLGK